MKRALPLFIILIIFTGLRIYKIDSKNLWFDEIYSWNISQGSEIQIISETSGDIHPPLFYTALKYWNYLFNDSIISMRLLSVIFALGGLFFFYLILKLFKINNLTIVITLLLFSVSPLNIYYSQEVRMLNLNMFLCLGSVYYFYALLFLKERYSGLKYFLFTILAFYTHYFSILIFISQIAAAFIFYMTHNAAKQEFKKFIFYSAGAFVMFIPWLPVFLRQITKGQPWRTQLTLFDAGKNILEYFKDVFLSPYYTYETMTTGYFTGFISVLTAILIFYAIIRLWNSGKLFSVKEFSIVTFVIIPITAAYFISLNQSIILSRYLSIIVPYLLASIVLLSFQVLNKRIAAAVCILYFISSIAGVRIYFSNNFKNNDYRKIISYIEENYNPGDRIITEPHFMGWSIKYHVLHEKSQLSKPEILGWNMKMQVDSLSERNDLDKIWFITDYSSLDKSGYDSLKSEMHRIGYKYKMSKTFYVVPSKVRVDYFVK